MGNDLGLESRSGGGLLLQNKKTQSSSNDYVNERRFLRFRCSMGEFLGYALYKWMKRANILKSSIGLLLSFFFDYGLQLPKCFYSYIKPITDTSKEIIKYCNFSATDYFINTTWAKRKNTTVGHDLGCHILVLFHWVFSNSTERGEPGKVIEMLISIFQQDLVPPHPARNVYLLQ